MKIQHLSFDKNEIQSLFDGINVSADTLINYRAQEFSGHVKHVSISGVQEKLLAVVDNGNIRLSKEGEQSTYIIKPTPSNDILQYKDEMVINEYLTMQIANRVYGIDTAKCALIRLADNHPAFIVKRFDIYKTANAEIKKHYQEDLCTLLGKTAQTHGSDFKYQGSYLEIAKCIRETLPTWRFEMPKFVSLVIFNFLFSNGDAHLKNFSILKHKDGTTRLSPAYDLLCTSLHINDSVFALSKGLGLTSYSEAYHRTFMPNYEDFYMFAMECGLTKKQTEKTLLTYTAEKTEIASLVNASMLTKKCKRMYLRAYQERLQCLLRKK